jgi:hypothetical protein
LGERDGEGFRDGAADTDAAGLGDADAAGLEDADAAGLEDADAAGLGDADAAGLGDADAAGLGDDDAAGLEDADAAGLGDDDAAGLEDADAAGLEDADAAGLGDDDGAGLGEGDGDTQSPHDAEMLRDPVSGGLGRHWPRAKGVSTGQSAQTSSRQNRSVTPPSPKGSVRKLPPGLCSHSPARTLTAVRSGPSHPSNSNVVTVHRPHVGSATGVLTVARHERRTEALPATELGRHAPEVKGATTGEEDGEQPTSSKNVMEGEEEPQSTL